MNPHTSRRLLILVGSVALIALLAVLYTLGSCIGWLCGKMR